MDSFATVSAPQRYGLLTFIFLLDKIHSCYTKGKLLQHSDKQLTGRNRTVINIDINQVRFIQRELKGNVIHYICNIHSKFKYYTL